MKKLFLLLIILSFISTNLYPQREVVIETFESWSGGLPTGYTYSWDPMPLPPGLCNQVNGYNGGSAIQLHNNADSTTGHFGISNYKNKIFYSSTTFPTSIKFYGNSNGELYGEHKISITFYDGPDPLNSKTVASTSNPLTIGNTGGVWYESSKKIELKHDFINQPPSDYYIEIRPNFRNDPGFPNSWSAWDDLTLVWESSIEIIEPKIGQKWICGEKGIVKWSDSNANDSLKIEYSMDGGISYTLITDTLKGSDGQYEWLVPEIEPTTKARIKITSLESGDEAESENFRIKPYIITRLDNNGDYITYDIDYDRWKFGNTANSVWPVWWWLRFNYQVNIDPFTNSAYSQSQGDSTFARSHMEEHPDWISFVNTFSESSCYISTTLGIYSPTALTKWKAINGAWKGSCFGMSNANALAFRKTNEFHVRYPDFPLFTDPINVNPDTNVIPIINEIFTHTFGNPAYLDRDFSNGKSVNETLADLKAMLKEDNTPIQTLYIRKNSDGPVGAHSILPYHLERDPDNSWLYYLWVYDNSYPNNTTAIITIDSSAYMGKGRWDPIYGWNGWGGDKWFYLEPLSDVHLNYATIPKEVNNQKSFMLPMSVEIDVTNKADIIITDSLGNSIGYQNNELINEIPYALPLIYVNGSEGLPYGYWLGIRNYSIELNNFTSDTVETYFFSQNKAFAYERYDVNENQTDELVYDGGIEVKNPDDANKLIRLINIVDGDDDERVYIFRGLEISKDESIKIINPDDYNLDLISKGSSKAYDIELNHATELGLLTFNYSDVELGANTTHKLKPNWGDFAALRLEILVDDGNDGTIDDTLHLEDQGTGVEEYGSNTLPAKFNLEQNYPNPFNPKTKISYSIPSQSQVSLKVFDVLGREVSVLVNKEQSLGNYEVEFDASNLTSGVYFYRIQTRDFIETKKMVLMK